MTVLSKPVKPLDGNGNESGSWDDSVDSTTVEPPSSDRSSAAEDDWGNGSYIGEATGIERTPQRFLRVWKQGEEEKPTTEVPDGMTEDTERACRCGKYWGLKHVPIGSST